MRKIEKEMLQAIEEGRNWTKDNTYINPVIGGIEVWLWNNHIATVTDTGLKVNKETLKRYPTVTTKSRLRALGADVSQMNNKIYLDNEFLCDV